MNVFNRFSPIVFLFICLVGCNKSVEHSNPKNIDVDLDKAFAIEIDYNQIVPLETTDSSLLYDVCGIAVYNDRIIVQSRSFIHAYDRYSGKYLYDIGKIGSAPGEYLGIQQFYNVEDTIFIVDFNRGCVHSFLKDGQHLGMHIDFHEIVADGFYTPNYVVKKPDNSGYYVINCFVGGTARSNPKFSILSNDNEFIAHVPGRELEDGSFTPDRMFTDFEHDRVLFWEQCRDTLFSVDAVGVNPLYVFDFGKNKFPVTSQNKKDFYDRSQDFINHKTGIPYASFIKYYQVKGDYLYFSFITSDDNVYLARYNEGENDLDILYLLDPHGKYKQSLFFKIENDEIIIAMYDPENMEANPVLYFLPISSIDTAKK